jgi:hypothetical protein
MSEPESMTVVERLLMKRPPMREKSALCTGVEKALKLPDEELYPP